MLDLEPETEARVREYAARDGVSVNELLTRTFATPRQPAPPSAEAAEQERARVQALLHKWQEETGGVPVPPGGFKSLPELFAQWREEDAKLTDEEIEEERRFWEDYERERPNRPLQM